MISQYFGQAICQHVWFKTCSFSLCSVDLLEFPGVPESAGLRTCNVELIVEPRARGMHHPSAGISLAAKGTSHPPLPSPFSSPTCEHPLELWGLHVLILGFCGVQELPRMDHLEENKNTPSPLSRFIFPTGQELFLFVFNSKSLGPLNSQIGSFLLSFSMECRKH